ncbi:hypothetical protein FHV99_001674 [Ochrobactrum sp. P20RRXII]|nr:hypothetical protein [Ochrobactrum sp. P20RRXII]NIH74467.1 hypothetical protein [Ochrobactrum sp. P20RRXII]
MPSKELIEKVARALFEAVDENTFKSKEDGDAWGVVDGEVNFHTQAQAAISTILAALQEPNAEMINALWSVNSSRGWPEAAKTCWQSAINASSLGEQSE